MADDQGQTLADGLRRPPGISFTRWNTPFIRIAIRIFTPLRRRARDVAIHTERAAGVPVRIYTPAGDHPRAALMWIHGGGLIVGAPAQDDARCARFARELGILVVSPDYRLAPRHRFPAALDDCHTAWLWTVQRARTLGMRPDRIALAGASAGGGLAASLAQRLHDEGGTRPVVQLLIYPMLDDRTVTRSAGDPTRHLVWTSRSNHTGWSCYLGEEPGGPQLPPYAAPARRIDLSGLPPAWIGVGSLDLFLAENREYADRLERSGVPCRLHVVEGAFHGFDSVMPRSSTSVSFAQQLLEVLAAHLGLQWSAPGQAGGAQ